MLPFVSSTGVEVTLTDQRKEEGKQETTYNVPKTRSMGTCRAARGFDDAKVWQKEPTGKQTIAALKEKEVANKLYISKDRSSGLLVITVYDSKWVKFCTTAHTEITVNELVRQIWDAEAKAKLGKVVFRLNVNDDYNNNMNCVDRVDQLFKNYYLKGNFRINKWWFTIWLWRLKKSVDNQWALYVRQCEIENEDMVQEREEAEVEREQLEDELPPLPPLVKVRPLTHAAFMEKVAEGLFAIGHNYALNDERTTTETGEALARELARKKGPWEEARKVRMTPGNLPPGRLICNRAIGSWNQIEGSNRKDSKWHEHHCQNPGCKGKEAARKQAEEKGTNKRQGSKCNKSKATAPKTRTLCLSCGFTLCQEVCFNEFHGIAEPNLK